MKANYLKTTLLTLLYGLLIWLIPFVLSFPFFSKEGELLISEIQFNVVMNFVFIVNFIFFLYRFIVKNKELQEKKIIQFGIIVFIMLIILDLIVLVGIFHYELLKFLTIIVPIYFLVIILCVFVDRMKAVIVKS